MTDLSINGRTEIDSSTPFCARSYFQKLREAGSDPYARRHPDGGVGTGLSFCNDDREKAMILHAWAHESDPDRTARGAFVKSVLDGYTGGGVELQDGSLIVQLGH